MGIKLKFFKKDPLEETFMRLAENELYEIVAMEVANEQVMPGIWGKAFSDTEGNMEKSRALYIKYRVQDLKDKAILELAKNESVKYESVNTKGESENVKYENKLNHDLVPLTEAEEQEAIDLIASLRKKKISATTKDELDEYLEDIKDGKFTKMDLRYLLALNARFSA